MWNAHWNGYWCMYSCVLNMCTYTNTHIYMCTPYTCVTWLIHVHTLIPISMCISHMCTVYTCKYGYWCMYTYSIPMYIHQYPFQCAYPYLHGYWICVHTPIPIFTCVHTPIPISMCISHWSMNTYSIPTSRNITHINTQDNIHTHTHTQTHTHTHHTHTHTHIYAMTQLHMCHDSSTYVPWPSHICAMRRHICALQKRGREMSPMSLIYVSQYTQCHDSSIYVPWPSHICAIYWPWVTYVLHRKKAEGSRLSHSSMSLTRPSSISREARV